jgi:hypothetical protein
VLVHDGKSYDSAQEVCLHIAAGTPIAEICRVALDANGLPVEVSEMTANSSTYIFRHELSADLFNYLIVHRACKMRNLLPFHRTHRYVTQIAEKCRRPDLYFVL